MGTGTLTMCSRNVTKFRTKRFFLNFTFKEKMKLLDNLQIYVFKSDTFLMQLIAITREQSEIISAGEKLGLVLSNI